MPHHCCVPLCTSDSRLSLSANLSFHTFPKNEEIKQKWIQKIRRDVGKHFNLNEHTRVCSLHFKETDYEIASAVRIRRRLKKNAVPTIFEWLTAKPVSRRQVVRIQPVHKHGKENVPPEDRPPQVIVAPPDHSYSKRVENSPNLPEYEAEDITTVTNTDIDMTSSTDGSDENDVEHSPEKAVLHKENLMLLKLRSEEKFSLLRFTNSDSDIRFYTGFSTYRSLSSFFQFLQPECNFLYYVGTENTSAGKKYELISKRGPSRALSPMEELFITLVRLRKGLPEKVIGDLYNLSDGHISKIVNTWIIFLCDRLRHLPIWPSQEHVKNNMPPAFKEHFPTTRVIIDCTEMFIEQPSAAACQRETFSSYKHHNTAKGLIGISPQGQITFISQLYAGRCSDKKIVRHCGLLDLICQNDSVMADKGFDIQEDLQKIGASLTMPPFLRDQDQFTEKQLKQTRNIAAVRVHVERAVRKVKEFDILRNTIPISLCPMLEKTWFVCAHLSNFTGNLFSNLP